MGMSQTKMSQSSKRAIILVEALLTIVFIAGCRTVGTIDAVPLLSTATETPITKSSPFPTSDKPATSIPGTDDSGLDTTHYALDVDLDYPDQVVKADELISIPHPGNDSLVGIVLVVPPANWRDVFLLDDLTSPSHSISEYFLEGIQLKIFFEEPGWEPGEVLELQIQFTLELPEQGTGAELGHTPFGYLDRSINLVDWFPMVPPFTVDGGWLIHPPWKFGEFLVYPNADYEVKLRTEDPELVVAASTLPFEVKDGSRRYRLENARNFVFSISPDYQILEGDAGETRVLGYFYSQDSVAGRAAFDATREAILLFSTLYGAYKQESISVVQADFYGSIEYQGLFFLNQSWYQLYNNTDRSFLVLIAVHETAHQWWYGQVANDQALEPWLDEALCTFSELAYIQNLNPGDESWWWKTRVENYQPNGRINRSIYQYENEDDPYLAYRNATYLQGVKFLSALKNEIGEDLFYDFLRDYVQRYQNQIATGEDFFDLLGEYVDLDELDWMGEYFQ
jgi:hypothetical protein